MFSKVLFCFFPVAIKPQWVYVISGSICKNLYSIKLRKTTVTVRFITSHL